VTRVPEAPLEDVGSGLAPVGDGWFVVNAVDAAWIEHPHFGRSCVFEASGSVLRRRGGLEPRTFPQLGINLAVLEPGKPSGLYHREPRQEAFLVLHGRCLLLVEGEERPLRAWDFVHCPPGTEHVFVGSGDTPCVLLRVGARFGARGIAYPRADVAVRHGAAADEETTSPHAAYAAHGHWQPGRPDGPILPGIQ
jgi:uncharacterized cupin superfamily protein